MSVIVKNKGKQDLEGRYNGEDITVPAGESVAMSEAAANHLVGYGIKGKTKADVETQLLSVAHRNGWHVSKDGGKLTIEQILKRFNDFEVNPAKLVADVPARGRGSQETEADDE